MFRIFQLLTFLIVFSAIIFACKKTPYSTSAAGWVIDRSDSTPVSYAVIQVAHWNGKQNSDTGFLMNRTVDTTGWFSLVFELDNNDDKYWIVAKKQGYENSSWESISGGYSNSVTVKMDTVPEE